MEEENYKKRKSQEYMPSRPIPGVKYPPGGLRPREPSTSEGEGHSRRSSISVNRAPSNPEIHRRRLSHSPRRERPKSTSQGRTRRYPGRVVVPDGRPPGVTERSGEAIHTTHYGYNDLNKKGVKAAIIVGLPKRGERTTTGYTTPRVIMKPNYSKSKSTLTTLSSGSGNEPPTTGGAFKPPVPPHITTTPAVSAEISPPPIFDDAHAMPENLKVAIGANTPPGILTLATDPGASSSQPAKSDGVDVTPAAPTAQFIERPTPTTQGGVRRHPGRRVVLGNTLPDGIAQSGEHYDTVHYGTSIKKHGVKVDTTIVKPKQKGEQSLETPSESKPATTTVSDRNEPPSTASKPPAILPLVSTDIDQSSASQPAKSQPPATVAPPTQKIQIIELPKPGTIPQELVRGAQQGRAVIPANTQLAKVENPLEPSPAPNNSDNDDRDDIQKLQNTQTPDQAKILENLRDITGPTSGEPKPTPTTLSGINEPATTSGTSKAPVPPLAITTTPPSDSTEISTPQILDDDARVKSEAIEAGTAQDTPTKTTETSSVSNEGGESQPPATTVAATPPMPKVQFMELPKPMSQRVVQRHPGRAVIPANTRPDVTEESGEHFDTTHYGTSIKKHGIKVDITIVKPKQKPVEAPPVEEPVAPEPEPEEKLEPFYRAKSKTKALLDYINTMSKMNSGEDFKHDHIPSPELIEDSNIDVVQMLKKFGIPDQAKALESLLDKDTVHYDFGGLMRQYYSYVLRSYCLINMQDRYRGANKASNCFTAVDISSIGSREEEMDKYTNAKLRRLDDKREQLRRVSADDDHFNYLKNLANNQATLLPLTLVHLMNEQMAPVLEDVFRFYGKNLGTEHKCTKVAGFHYVKMRKRVSMYTHICGGSTLNEDLTPYYK